MKITYLGHSAFEIETNGEKFLIDPFLIMAPDYNPTGVKEIFVTHAHSDHLGNAIEISRKNGSCINAVFELANYCSAKGAKNVRGLNIGGELTFNWGKASLVPAFHSSSTPDGTYGGCPCGFVFSVEGKTLYHAGDTGLSSELKTIGEIYKPDIAMLPVGGIYTMDIEKAAIASDWLGAKTVIPMHYNTFDAIRVDINDFSNRIQNLGKTPCVMKPQSFVEL